MTAQKITKRLFLLAISIAFLFAPKITFAAWIKYSANPIISATKTWEGLHIANPMVLFHDGVYKMWYGGSIAQIAKIGYAYSLNGITNWQKLDGPIITSSPSEGYDEKEIGHPFIIYSEDKRFEMWFVASSYRWASGPDRSRLRYATSTDGINWTVYPNYILTGTTGTWDSGGISRGVSVIRENGIYKMWYTGTDNGNNWKIGFATSPNGISWTKYPSPVILPTESWEKTMLSYPFIIFDEAVYKMWYTATQSDTSDSIIYAYSSNETDWQKPSSENPIINKGSGGDFDSIFIVSPSILKKDGIFKLWYSGYNGSRWQIGYAQNQEIIIPTIIPTSSPMPTPLPTATPSPLPTATPTTSPTPSPSPTPTPTPPHLLVFLPGLGASWNHQTILTGEDRPPTEWFMTPGVHIYDGLIQTFKNAGYQTEGPNKNLFIFNYNWTKPVDQIAEDLKNYLIDTVNPVPAAQIDLVGHSLGGLVGRTFQQQYSHPQVNKIINVGSPQHGVAQVYYLWEGGEVSRLLPGWQRFGAELLLHVRTPGSSTTKDTIQQTLPVMRDLLPTFNYLKLNGTEKPVTEMVEQNHWLNELNTAPPTHLTTRLNTFAGLIPDSSLRWLNVQNRTWLDKILNLYPDGRPISQELATGDRTVLEMSAHLNGETQTNLPDLNHSDLVSQPSGIQKIMEVLNLTPSEISHLSENFNFDQALIFQIASPAIISAKDGFGNPVGFTDGKLLVIPNASEGNYQLEILGTGSGLYSLCLGQITPVKDYWTIYAGSTGLGQPLVLPLYFQPDSPLENPIIDPTGAFMIKSAQAKINLFKNYLDQNLANLILKIYLFNQTTKVENLLAKNKIEQAIKILYQMRLQINLWPGKNLLQEIIEDLEQVYVNRQTGQRSYSQRLISQEIKTAQNQLNLFETKLKQKSQKGLATIQDGLLFQLAQQKLNQAKNSLSYESHINALGARYLSQEGLLILH